MTTRTEIIEIARETLGWKWVHQGRGPQGIDCVGVVIHTADRLGIDVSEAPKSYRKSAQWSEFEKHFRRYLKEKNVKDAKPGDVLIFRQEIFPCHCGILTTPAPEGTPRFIHGYAIRGKVVEERFTPDWRKLTRTAFEYPNVED